ncbi:polysaccharide deacetylase family protein [Pelosinus propionicus]|uniref:Peptidoglycan/xylan/chitin deacetylase, PgdA/CDA1 family n=1 Tax=Pelosinus propionicus DSM 13327 TaxID=1123291 RepID=A0A1I4HCF1_9FIRM|nr:polysaccharide deacetylase family protein [Pelosinus propionicus]SFL39972.1 Peptidoglycan/xylan/chitin deacetylase, PgdA/CDA1 family [Pelosinus propionicus DSM 13327]
MLKNYGLLSIICLILLIALIFLISSPLSFAVPNLKETPSISTTTKPSEKGPDVYYFTEKSNSVPTNDKSEYDILTVQERKERQLTTNLTPVEPYYGNKTIYLTFDDGPDPQNTPLILAILQESNIKATFFLVGTEVSKYPELVKQIYAAGHAIGNHTYNHIYRELYQSPAAYIEQLQHNDELLKNILNVRPRISRAPGGTAGHFTAEYWKRLKNEGYIEVGWNISSGDASNAKADALLQNIISQTNKNTFLWSHAILLMHDGRGHSETVKALPSIINFYKEQGFEFRVINTATPPAW